MTTALVRMALVALVLSTSALSAQEGTHVGSLTPFASARELEQHLLELAEARNKVLAARHAAEMRAAGCTTTVSIARHAVPGPASGVPASAVVLGLVTIPTGAPIEGASVSLLPGTAAVTDADGRFRLSIPADLLPSERSLMLSARRIGYRSLTHDLRVGRGDSTEVRVPLCISTLRLSEITVAQSAANAPEQESITNVQHAGVDEGGIVKLHGDHLVVLRRGRLFTIAVGDDALRPIAAVDAFGPGIDPDDGWYDEMLIHGDKVVVIGYNYGGGGTEIGVFDLDRRGGLRHRSTHHLRSDDYYSSRNYASRLVGSTLIFYTPLYLAWNDDRPLEAMPAMRRWTPGGPRGDFSPIATPARVYRSPRPIEDPTSLTLHTVTRCDLAAAELTCEATSVLGPAGRTFYVSPTAVYVWVSDWLTSDTAVASSQIYRLPLDGSAPTALAASGSPVDQFSFLEKDDHLNVVVRSEGSSDAMWSPERSGGSVSLLRVSLSRFGNGRSGAPRSAYRRLPLPGTGTFQNRFVGDVLLYGAGKGWADKQRELSVVHVVPLNGADMVSLALPHGADRIEPMGASAVVIGAGADSLHFSGIRLSTDVQVVQHHAVPDATQGELRSHGFFYRADGPGMGVIGLPVRGASEPGWHHLLDGSASIVFLRNTGNDFAPLGALAATTADVPDDDCKASCVDWYGNARPLFFRGRVFALLGYELVEGRMIDSRIREIRRVSFAPSARNRPGLEHE